MARGTIRTITANGIQFGYLERGTGPLVLCLHTFPDTAFSFKETLTHLAVGYRAVGRTPVGSPLVDSWRIHRQNARHVTLTVRWLRCTLQSHTHG